MKYKKVQKNTTQKTQTTIYFIFFALQITIGPNEKKDVRTATVAVICQISK